MPVLDPQALDSLRELERRGATGLVAQIVSMFNGSLEARLRALRDGAATTPKDLEHAAHALRGSAAQVGAMELAALCTDLERRAAQGATADAAELGRIEEAAARARTSLEEAAR